MTLTVSGAPPEYGGPLGNRGNSINRLGFLELASVLESKGWVVLELRRKDRGRCLPWISRSKISWSILVFMVNMRILAAMLVGRSFLELFPEVESCGKAVGYLISGKDHYILTIEI